MNKEQIINMWLKQLSKLIIQEKDNRILGKRDDDYISGQIVILNRCIIDLEDVLMEDLRQSIVKE